MPDGSLPVLTRVALLNDTGSSPTDGLTWDPTVVGTITNDDGFSSTTVEIDADGDGAADDTCFPDENGNFEFAQPGLEPGPVSYRLRTTEWDAASGLTVTGPWSDPPFVFTYEYPPNAAPQVASVGLSRDTGTPGDRVTFDPTVEGTVTDDRDPADAQVEYDANNDGAPDGLTFVGTDGRFSLDPDVAGPGLVSVRVRAREWDVERNQFLDSPRSAAFTFTVVRRRRPRSRRSSWPRTPGWRATTSPTTRWSRARSGRTAAACRWRSTPTATGWWTTGSRPTRTGRSCTAPPACLTGR